MPAPMQISLEEVISMLLQRVEGLAANDENNKTKANIVNRVLYKKGLITDEEIKESVKEEYRMLKELGAIKEEPKEDVYQTVADGIVQWLKGDTAAIKKTMEDYQKKLEEMAREEEAKKPKIAVAGAGVLSELDQMSNKNGGKLIV
jgi:glutamyl/glutaminyl-tRNA synthetase